MYRGVGSKMASHRFCATCGVPVCITTDVELPKEMLDSFPEELRDRIQKLPLNLHLIEGLEFGKMDILKETEGQEGYEIPE